MPPGTSPEKQPQGCMGSPESGKHPDSGNGLQNHKNVQKAHSREVSKSPTENDFYAKERNNKRTEYQTLPSIPNNITVHCKEILSPENTQELKHTCECTYGKEGSLLSM